MEEEPTFLLDQTGWRNGAHDGLEVYADRIILNQRTTGSGGIVIPKAQITEVRTQGMWSLDGRGYRLHLRVGPKKYVLRRLKKEEAEGAAAAIHS